MTDTLSEAGNAAGLRDPDLLRIARTDIPPADAIAELRTTYPLAFESLAQMAGEFELIDISALALARPGLPPRQAMEALKQELPSAFKPPFNARTATRAECDAKMAELNAVDRKRRHEARDMADLARLAARQESRK